MPRPPLNHPAVRAALLFALALGLRLLFVTATDPDRLWPYSVGYKGDAVLWMRYAWSLQDVWGSSADIPLQNRFELGLPLRPPGTGYLLGWIWDRTPDSVPAVRALWALLGALLAPLLYLGARRQIGEGPALFAGAVAATSTALILLSASLNAETPYLLLATATVVATPALAARPRWEWLSGLGALHGLASLVRAEHALFAVLATGWMVLRWRRQAAMPAPLAAGRAAVVALAAVLVTVPWHRHAFAQIERFQYREVSSPVKTAGALRWSTEARARIDALPGFLRGSVFATIDAIVSHRGGTAVDVGDLAVLEEATGSWPEPLAAHPWVALYGPLNFALANHLPGDGGFTRALLDAPPPLPGGRDRYPPAWLAQLPGDGALTLQYPPHVYLINHGYRAGLATIAADPWGWVQLAAAKVARFWAGVAHGFGGVALPLGPGGVRWAVDIVVPDGVLALLWRALVLVALGLWLRPALAHPQVMPFALWLAAQLAVTLAFFGYARMGAMAVPAVAVLLGVGGAHRLARCSDRARRRWRRVALAAIALVVAGDAVRWCWSPTWELDGQPVTSTDPWPVDVHQTRAVVERW